MTEGTEAQRHRGTKGGWRRWAVRTTVCLGAGAALTVLTAAASLLYAPVMMTDGRGGVSSTDSEGQTPGSVLFKPGQVYQGVGIRETVDYWVWISSENPVLGEPSHVSGAGVPTVNVGWPLLAFTSPPVMYAGATSYAEFQAATEHAYGRAATTAAPEFLRARPHRVVPGRILPLGFAVNTMLFASIAGVVLLAPGAVRRSMRRRGGRCVGCGYPLTGGERCPECGDAAPQGGVRRGRSGRGGRYPSFAGSDRAEGPHRDLGGTAFVSSAPLPFVPLYLCASVPSRPEATT